MVKSKLKNFKGAIIEENEMVGVGTFKMFVRMSDGTSCYHRIEDGDDERAWYTRKPVICPDGERLNLFFIEGFDGQRKEFDEYVKTLNTK